MENFAFIDVHVRAMITPHIHLISMTLMPFDHNF